MLNHQQRAENTKPWGDNEVKQSRLYDRFLPGIRILGSDINTSGGSANSYWGEQERFCQKLRLRMFPFSSYIFRNSVARLTRRKKYGCKENGKRKLPPNYRWSLMKKWSNSDRFFSLIMVSRPKEHALLDIWLHTIRAVWGWHISMDDGNTMAGRLIRSLKNWIRIVDKQRRRHCLGQQLTRRTVGIGAIERTACNGSIISSPFDLLADRRVQLSFSRCV